MRQNLLLTFALAAICAMPAQAQNGFARENKVARYLSFNGKDIAAYVDERTGTPSWVIDVDSLDFFLGRPEALTSREVVLRKAKAFLLGHRALFKIHPSALSNPRITTDGRFWFITFGQNYKGLPVIGSQVGLTLSRDGRIGALGVHAFPTIALNTTPTLNALGAAQRARDQAGLDQRVPATRQELAILAVGEADSYAFKLAWELRLEKLDGDVPVSRSFLVDAHRGDILSQRDNVVRTDHGYYIVPAPGETDVVEGVNTPITPPYAVAPENEASWLYADDTQGMLTVSGNVTLNYYETPDNYTNQLIRRTNQPFKGARVDIENDATGATQTTLANSSGNYSFSGLSSGSHTVTFFIENERARINSGVTTAKREKSFTINVSGSTTQNYAWGWGDDGDADQSTTAMGLNSVYQINEQYAYMKNTLGYDGMDGATLRNVNIQTSEAGSTSPPIIWLGRQFALSSEVAHHEYMHNVIYTLYGNRFIQNSCSGCDPDYNFQEAQAMDEAFADYFTNARADDHTYGGPSDSANDPSFPPGEGVTIRFLYNSYTMNDFSSWTSPHLRSRIISGAAWRVRIDVGNDADELAFEALQVSPQPQSFVSFGRNMYVADDLLNNNANRADIEQRFVERLILPPLAPTSLTAFDGGGGDVDLSWNNLSSLEDGYDVQRRLNGGSWSTMASLGANTTSYTDEDVFCRAGSNNYEYRIRVYDGGLEDFSPIRAYDPCLAPRVVTDNNGLGIKVYEASLVSAEVPTETLMEPAYPNPFNPVTTIRYALASATKVQLVVYDMLGRVVETLVDGVQQAGRYDVSFDAGRLPSGLYLYRLETEKAHFSNTMLLVK